RRRGLRDRTAQTLVRDVGDQVPVEGDAGLRLTTTGRGHVMDLGLVRLPQSAVMLRPIVVEDDLLIHVLDLHQRLPKKATVYSNASASASTSAAVVYR